MAEIQLTQGQIATVDDNLAEVVSQYSWYAHWDYHSHTFRAMRTDRSEGKQRTTYMHRFIWELVNGPVPSGLEIDHINGDTLDNRLSKLKLVTTRGNQSNRKRRRDGKTSSQYPGVTWNKQNKKWKAQIIVNGRQEYLGYFDSEEEAAKVYQQVLSDIGEGVK